MATRIGLCLFLVFIGVAKTVQTGSYSVETYGCKHLYKFNPNVTKVEFSSTFGNETYYAKDFPVVLTFPPNSSMWLSVAITNSTGKFTTYTTNNSTETCCNDTVRSIMNCHKIRLSCPETCKASNWPEFPNFGKTRLCNGCFCKYCYIGNISTFYKLELPLNSSSHMVGIHVSGVNKTSIEVIRPRREMFTFFELLNYNRTGVDTGSSPHLREIERYFDPMGINGSIYFQAKDKRTLPRNGQIQFYLHFSTPNNDTRLEEYNLIWVSPLDCNATTLNPRYYNDPFLRLNCEKTMEKTIVYNISNPNFQMKDNFIYLKDLTKRGSFNISITAMYEGLTESAMTLSGIEGQYLGKSLVTVHGCRAVLDLELFNFSRLHLYSPQLGLNTTLLDRQPYNITLPSNETITFDFTTDEGTVHTLTAASTEDCCKQSMQGVFTYICFTLRLNCSGVCAISAWPNFKDLYKTSECTGCNCSYCYSGASGGSTQLVVSENSSTYQWTVPIEPVSKRSIVLTVPYKELSNFRINYSNYNINANTYQPRQMQRHFNIVSINGSIYLQAKDKRSLPQNGQLQFYFHALMMNREVSSLVSLYQYDLFWFSPLRCNVSYFDHKYPKDPFLSIDCKNTLKRTIIYKLSNSKFQMKNNSLYLNDLTIRGSFTISITAMYNSLPESATTIKVPLEVISDNGSLITTLAAVKDSENRCIFTCYTNSKMEDLTYKWYWNEVQVFSGLSSSMRNGKSQGTIVLDGLKENDSGNLTCKVTKKDGKTGYLDKKIKSITMKDFPMVKLNTTSHIIKNEIPVNVSCHLIPPYKNSKLVFKVNNKEISETEVQLSKESDVSCYAVNDVGRGEIKTLQTFVAIGKKICPAMTYKELKWPETIETTIANVPCIGEFSGTVSRFCSINGKWEEELDYSNCAKKSILDAKSTLSRIERNGGTFETVVEKLANATKGSLKAKDISETMGALDIAFSISKNSEQVSREEVEGFVDVVSNLVGNDTKTAWTNLEKKNQLTAVSILKRIENFGEIASQKINESVSIETDNLVLQFKKFDVTKNIQFPDPINNNMPEWAEKSETKVYIPSNILKNNFDANKPVAMNAVIFRNMKELLPKSENTSTVNSYILAISLGKPLVNLKENVSLSFELLSKELYNYRPSCSFWDFKKNPEQGGSWSTKGCEVASSNSSYTVCNCDHLTNFAILMKFRDHNNSKALGIITDVGCSISIIALIVTMIIYGISWKDVTSQDVTRSQSILLMNLCVSLLIAYLLFLTVVEETEIKSACTVIAALIHYFLLVSFFSMLAEGVDMAIALTVVFTSKVSRLPWLIGLSWGAPALIVGISLAVTKTKGYGNSQFCWLSPDNYVNLAFIVPVLVIIVANIVCVILIVKALLSAYCMLRESVKERLRAGARAIGILTPLLGFTWLFGVFAVNEDTVVFEYIFTVANSLQGVFIFLSYCVFNKQIRKSLKKRDKSTSLTPTKPSSSLSTGTKTTELPSVSKKDNSDYLRESSEIMSDNSYEDYSHRYSNSILKGPITPYYINPTLRMSWDEDKL